MGHDFRVYIDDDQIDSVFRFCTGNLHDMWSTYSTGPEVWHGHTSLVLLHNIQKAITALRVKGVQLDDYVTIVTNPDYYWGVTRADKLMVGDERDRMFLTWLTKWRSIVESKHTQARWFSDQVWSATPYDMDGVIVEAGTEPVRRESDSD